eukprot:CAMPEP_0179844586 /NCGR_PEP_ID=MMETSP0982-20121206/4426_1 /TAXON_ID=483367 /ORGANISM="non described non described, Strain CCMP 2436" /LENGTH=136 /DNA_ID=CAMNT_0021729309 /DNA_START=477 /DNA_END=883 /DNA_ORIENTATION=+
MRLATEGKGERGPRHVYDALLFYLVRGGGLCQLEVCGVNFLGGGDAFDTDLQRVVLQTRRAAQPEFERLRPTRKNDSDPPPITGSSTVRTGCVAAPSHVSSGISAAAPKRVAMTSAQRTDDSDKRAIRFFDASPSA